MTLYAGEEFRITASGTDFDGTPLTDDNVNDATVQIYDATGDIVQVETSLTWDSDEELWEYLWDTTGLAAGGYRYRVTFVGSDGKSSWEWRRIRLARNPFSA